MLYEYKGTVLINGNFVQSSTGLKVEAENKKEAIYLLTKRLRNVYRANADVQINLNTNLVCEVGGKTLPKIERKPLIDLEEVLKKKKADKKKKEETKVVEDNSETNKEETNGAEN